MKVQSTERQVTSSGATTSAAFGISQAAQTHIMSILRDTLYSDKVLAVLREYAANAWDANRTAGRGDKPIRVTLPTDLEPTLKIRDFGPGLSEDEVFKVYTQYGESTKRDDDDAVGFMGIGSKSGFCYSDTFTITSWNGGWRKVYVAVLDESDAGLIQKLSEEECADPDGLEISIAARPGDITEFRTKAQNLFRHFNPQPEINCELRQIRRSHKKHGWFTSDEAGWVAVMGCIPYRINLAQIQTELEETGTWDPLSHISGGVHFDIGEVQVNASREELKYSAKTKAALAARLSLMVEEYLEDVLETLRGNTASPWDKRQKALFMEQSLKILLPARHRHWGAQTVILWDTKAAAGTGVRTTLPDTFRLVDSNNKPAVAMSAKGTELLILDDDRAFGGFNLKHTDLVVKPLPIPGLTLDAVRAELDALLEELELTGISISGISTRNWWKPHGRNRGERELNPKHATRCFRLIGQSEQQPLSDNWEIADRAPTPDDIWVVISNFKVEPQKQTDSRLNSHGENTFYAQVAKDKAAARSLGVAMPEIYAYKTTTAKPIDATTLQGTSWFDWRIKFCAKLLNKTMRDLAQVRRWESKLGDKWEISQYRRHLTNLITRVCEQLGPAHDLTRILASIDDALLQSAKFADSQLTTLDHLIKVTGTELTFRADEAVAALLVKYPMFVMCSISHLIQVSAADTARFKLWMDYFKTIDRCLALDDGGVPLDVTNTSGSQSVEQLN